MRASLFPSRVLWALTLTEVNPNPMNPKHQYTDLILMHVIVLIWGYTGIIGKWSELSADLLVFLRMLIAAAVLVPIVIARRAASGVGWAERCKYLGVGVVIAGHWVTFFAAIDVSNVTVALSCMATTSVFAALLEPVFYRRPVAWSEVLIAGAAALGVSLIFGALGQLSAGVALALLSSLLAALFTILNGKLFQAGGRASVMSAHEMVGGCVALLVYQLLASHSIGGFAATVAGVPAREWLLAAILGLVCTALPFVFSIKVMRSLSPFSVCLAVNLEPVYAILLALFHFGNSERMTPLFYLGSAVILLAVLTDGLFKIRRQTRLKAAAAVTVRA